MQINTKLLIKDIKCCFIFMAIGSIFPLYVNAQANIIVQLKSEPNSQEEKKFIKKINKQYHVKDSLSAIAVAEQIKLKALSKGFPESEYYFNKNSSTQYDLNFSFGKHYRWINLKFNPLYRDILYKSGFRTNDYRNSIFNYNKLDYLFENCLITCENMGYPFAQIGLDSVRIEHNTVSAYINLQLFHLVKIDSVIIKGNPRVSEYFLTNYIGVKSGDVYRESKIKAIENRIKELSFVREIKPFEFTFTPKENKLILYLEHKKANQFDGVLGFLPSEKTNKIEFTGQAHLKLLNALKQGELIDVDWRKLQSNSRDIKAKLSYPYLLNTPLGIDLNLKLFQKDTTFIEATQNAGLQLLQNGNNYYKVFINNRNLSLVSTAGLDKLTSLPNYADVRTISYGVGLKREKVDYRINPRKGIIVIANISAGNKYLRQNPKINEKLYENVEKKSPVSQGDIHSDIYIPLLKRSTINIGLKAAAMYTRNLFTNESFRIGGNSNLRGFDEESIYASAYSIGNIEYRYIFEQNSFLFIFFNGAYYELKTNQSYIKDNPYGFGAGISFQTKAGIFSISYALGKQFNNPIQLRSGKVHFGIVSLF